MTYRARTHADHAPAPVLNKLVAGFLLVSMASGTLGGCGFRPLYSGGAPSPARVAMIDVAGSELCADTLNSTLSVAEDSPISVQITVKEELIEENIGANREAARLTLRVETQYLIYHRGLGTQETFSTIKTQTFTKPESQLAQTLETENAGKAVCASVAADIERAVRQASDTK